MAVAVLQQATLPRSPRRRASVNAGGRGRNHARAALADERRCECERPACRAMLPAGAEAYRGYGERVVVPAHFDGDGVVRRAADRFFVIGASRS